MEGRLGEFVCQFGPSGRINGSLDLRFVIHVLGRKRMMKKRLLKTIQTWVRFARLRIESVSSERGSRAGVEGQLESTLCVHWGLWSFVGFMITIFRVLG